MHALQRGVQTTLHQVRHDSITRRYAIVVLVANIVAIAMPIAMELRDLTVPRHLNLMADGSWPEYLNYAQTAFCALLLVLLWSRLRLHALLALAATFMAVFLDDMLRYHERFGTLLTKWLDLPALPLMRATDTGELLAMAIAGAVFLPLVLFALRQKEALANGLAAALIACLAALVFCGAGLDALHVAANNSNVIGYFEDGGEMLAMAIASIVALGYARPLAARSGRLAVPA